MTLATGNARPARSSHETTQQAESGLSATKRTAGREGGFTLIEILVVIAIIIILFSLVTVSMGTYLGRAYGSATTSLILRVEQHLDEYRRITGYFPSDGIDYPVETQGGVPIRGAACLYYFLTRPIVVDVVVGGIKRPKEYPAIVPAGFRSADLLAEDPDHPGVRVLVDAWNNPLHYDNTEDGVFRPQGGEAHIPPIEEGHPLDPRSEEVTVNDQPVVPRPGQVQSNEYDLWSNAGQGYEGELPTGPPIASWNIK